MITDVYLIDLEATKKEVTLVQRNLCTFIKQILKITQ